MNINDFLTWTIKISLGLSLAMVLVMLGYYLKSKSWSSTSNSNNNHLGLRKNAKKVVGKNAKAIATITTIIVIQAIIFWQLPWVIDYLGPSRLIAVNLLLIFLSTMWAVTPGNGDIARKATTWAVFTVLALIVFTPAIKDGEAVAEAITNTFTTDTKEPASSKVTTKVIIAPVGEWSEWQNLPANSARRWYSGANILVNTLAGETHEDGPNKTVRLGNNRNPKNSSIRFMSDTGEPVCVTVEWWPK